MNIENKNKRYNVCNAFTSVIKQIVTTLIYTTDDKMVRIVPDILYRFGLALTAWVPTSPRGLGGYLILKPVRLVQSLYKAFKSNQVFEEVFHQSMQNYHDRDWNGGIHDNRQYATSEEAKNYLNFLKESDDYEDNDLEVQLQKIGFKKIIVDKLPLLNDFYEETIKSLEALGFQKTTADFSIKQPLSSKGFNSLIYSLNRYVYKLFSIYKSNGENLQWTIKSDAYKRCKKKLEKYGFSNSFQPTNSDFKNLNKVLKNYLYERYYYSEKTGTIFSLQCNDEFNEVIIDFKGLGASTFFTGNIYLHFKTLLNILVNFFGVVDAASIEAIKVGEVVKKHFSQKEDAPTVVAMGHSHGGGLAQCAAIANDLNGVVFNSRPNGSGIRRYLGSDKIANNKITSFLSETDWLNDRPYLCKLGLFFERLIGIPMPRNMANKTRYLKVRKKSSGVHNEYATHLQELAHSDK